MFDCDPPTLNEYIPLNVHLPRFDLDEEEDREDDVYDALEQLQLLSIKQIRKQL